MREWITIQPVNPLTPAKPWLVTLGSLLAVSAMSAAVPQTRVSIADGRWHIDGEVTYRDAKAEGLLLNVWMVSAAFEERRK